jgi:hypothetical protein
MAGWSVLTIFLVQSETGFASECRRAHPVREADVDAGCGKAAAFPYWAAYIKKPAQTPRKLVARYFLITMVNDIPTEGAV